MKKIFALAFVLSFTAMGVNAQETKPCCKKQGTEQKDCKKGGKPGDKKLCPKGNKTARN